MSSRADMTVPKVYAAKADLYPYNPVVAGIVDEPEAYVHSSARNYVGRTCQWC